MIQATARRNRLLSLAAMASVMLCAQNQTPPNTPSPDAGVKQQLEGLWGVDDEFNGTFNNGGGRFHSKRSVSCVISGVGNPDGFTARCRMSAEYTYLDQQGGFTRDREGNFRLTRQGRKISGYADYARARDNSGEWQDFPAGSSVEGALSYSAQLSIRIEWDKQNSDGVTLRKR